MTYPLTQSPYPLIMSPGVLTSKGRISHVNKNYFTVKGRKYHKRNFHSIQLTFEKDGQLIVLCPDLDDKYLNLKTIDDQDIKLHQISFGNTWLAVGKEFDGFLAKY